MHRTGVVLLGGVVDSRVYRGLENDAEFSLREHEDIVGFDGVVFREMHALVDAQDIDRMDYIKAVQDDGVGLDHEKGVQVSDTGSDNANVAIFMTAESAPGTMVGEVISLAILSVVLDDNDAAGVRKVGGSHLVNGWERKRSSGRWY